MNSPLLQILNEHRPPTGVQSRRADDECERLVRQINEQRTEPDLSEKLAMVMIVLVFVGAVLAFSLAATKII